MSDPGPVEDAAELRHELEQIDVELDTLWRIVFGAEPRPTRRRRALARLWTAAITVEWRKPRPEPPIGLVLVDDPD